MTGSSQSYVNLQAQIAAEDKASNYAVYNRMGPSDIDSNWATIDDVTSLDTLRRLYQNILQYPRMAQEV